MNLLTRRNIIIGGVALLIIIAAVVVLLAPQNPPGTSVNQTGNNTQQSTGISNISPTARPSFKDIVKSGKTQICTFNVKVDNQTTTGTIYSANGKLRGDFTIPVVQGTVQQHIIVDSYMAYMWTNITTDGIKFAVQDENPTQLTDNSTLNCTDWLPNASVFELPANIVFTEFAPSASPTP